MKRTFLRVVSMCLAVIMLVGAANLSVFASGDTGNNTQTLQSTVRANVARNGSGTEKTDGQIVAEMYRNNSEDEDQEIKLSLTEQQILSNTALLGNTYVVELPDASLVAVDSNNNTVVAQTKVVTLKSGGVAENAVWTPVTVGVYVGDILVGDTIPYVAGGVTYDPKGNNNYSIKVDYKLTVSVAEETQKLLLGAPLLLANAVSDLKAIESTIASLNTLAEYLEELQPLSDGIVYNGLPVSFDDGPNNAYLALKADKADENGQFDVCFEFDTENNPNAYSAGSTLQYLTSSGAEMGTLVSAIHPNLVALGEGMGGLQYLLGLIVNKDESYKSLLTAVNKAVDMINKVCAVYNNLSGDYTKVNSVLKADAIDAELSALDDLIAASLANPAVGEEGHDADKVITSHDVSELMASYTVAQKTVVGTVNQNIISVDVVAYVYEEGATVTTPIYGVTDYQIVLDKGVDAVAIKNAIEASGIIATSVNGWDNFYGVDEQQTYYEIGYVNVPDSLTEDTECVITFTPKEILPVDYDYAADQLVGYGYWLKLPEYEEDLTLGWEYTINDSEKRDQGELIRVTSDIKLSRTLSKALNTVKFPEFIADSAVPGADILSEKDRNILKSDGLLSEEIAYSALADKGDVEITVEPDGSNRYIVTAPTFPARIRWNGGEIKRGTWMPTAVEVAVDGASGTTYVPVSGTFTDGTMSFDYNSAVNVVRVVYTLTVGADVLPDGIIEKYTLLPSTLATEAQEQKNQLTTAVDLLGSLTLVNSIIGDLTDTMKKKNDGEEAYYSEKIYNAGKALSESGLKGGSLLLVSELEKYATKSGKTYVAKSAVEMLGTYYRGENAENLIEQFELLREVFNAINADPEDGKPDIKADLQSQFGDIIDMAMSGETIYTLMEEYGEDVNNISLISVNESIDRDADLAELCAGLLAGSGSTPSNVPDEIVYQAYAIGESAGTKTISVVIEADDYSGVKEGTLIFAVDDTFDQNNVTKIQSLIDTLTAGVEASLAMKYYDVTKPQLPDPELNSPVSDYSKFVVTYTPKTYTVQIVGSSATVPAFTYKTTENSMKIVLPEPPAGTVYRYNINGYTHVVDAEKYEDTKAFTIKNATVLDALFGSGQTLEITFEEVNVTREKFIEFVNAMNDAFKAGNMDAELILAADPADYSLVLRVGPDIAGVQFNSMMNDLMTAMTTYSSIKLADTVFYEGVSINMQAIVDMLASSGFSFDTVCKIIDENGNIKNDAELATLTNVNNIGGKIMSTKMGLGEVMTIDFYMTLSGSNDKLLAARNALETVKNYVNLTCEDGVYNIHLNMPDKLYPYYMSAMLLLDQTQFENIQGGMNVEQTMKYYKNLVTDLTGDPNFTVETLENTAAEAGKNIDLSTYASTFDLARKLINYLLNNATAEKVEGSDTTNKAPENERHERYAATITCPVGGLTEYIPESFADIADLISEIKNNGNIVFDINLTVEDRKVDYDAMIFDNSEAGLDKFYYSKADEFASDLAHLGNNSVVILISDAELKGDVVIKNNVFINLNGKKLTITDGTLSTTARVTISDSTLHTNEPGVGEVNGTLSGNFIITGGKYSMDVTAMLKDGYVQDDANGYVSNIFYIIEEDADGNISINIPANILSTRTVPEIKALAVDIAMDVAFNVYNMASMGIDIDKLVDDPDGKYESIYSFATDDLISLATMSGKEIAQELINKVNVDNVKTLAQSIYYELTNFSDVATKINSDNGVIVDYELATKGWGFQFSVSEENTIVVDLVPDKQDDRTFSIAVTGSEEDKALLAALFTEVGKSLKYDPTINHLSIAYNGGLDVDFDGELNVEIDLSHNNNYAALLVAAVASANNDANLKSILKTYLDETTKTEASTTALNTALENITLAQFVKGLQHLKAVGCDEMLASIGSTNTADLKKLEAIYDDLVYIAGVVLTRLDITGGEQKLAGHKVADTFSTYNYGPKTITFDKRGVEVSMTLTLTMTMMKEVTGETPIVPPGPGPDPIVPTPGGSTSSKPVIKHPTLNADASSDKLLGVAVATVGSDKYLQLDLHVDGITVEELLESLHISATGSRVEIEAAVTNSKTVDGKEIVVTGSVLTITAKNSRGTTTKEYVIVIDGDVNCDGYVNTADAVYLAWHYCDIASIEGTAAMIAATGNSKDTDVHADDAMRIVFKYLHWKAGDDRYVSKFGS